MTDIFERLESNDKKAVEDTKQSLREQFIKVNDPWLLNGLYDYYLNTNSIRSMDILVNIKEPHHQYLFDRSQKTEIKVQALTLLGHVTRSQPTWLYKLQDHNLLKDIFKLLKTEVELLPLISALLLLIVLLPIIPSTMGYYLKDIFDIFSRLASWNCSSGKFVEDQNVHMQVALYALFLRLYGMYPCNFLGYLRTQYKEKNNPVFVHTIKLPKDNETTTERWKKMGVHDVIVECERFSLDLTDRCPHDACQNATGFRSRSGTSNSTIEPSYHLQNLKNLASLQMPSTDSSYFTPSMVFHVQTPPVTETAPTNIPHVQGVQSSNFPSQEGTSPPEAAIEATPETTPIRDFRTIHTRSQPLNSNIARALTSFNKSRSSGSQTTTPTHSQPSSPMRKEISPFNFSSESKSGSAFVKPKRDSVSNQKLTKLILERSQVAETTSDDHFTKNKNLPTPSSPLRIISSETVSRQFSPHQRIESPITQEDEEVLSIVSKSDSMKHQVPRACDSVLPEFDDCSSDNLEEEQEHGSPCTAGGLHMPNSKSMNNFAKRVQRLRYHSQCNPEPERIETSTGSSPGNSISFPNSTTVRRANSCPEMKKSPVYPTKDNISKPLDETDEETTTEVKVETILNNSNGIDVSNKRDTVQLQQRDIDDLRKQLDCFKRERLEEDKKLNKTIQYWENQCKSLQQECKVLKETNEELVKDLSDAKSKCALLDVERQQAESALLDAIAEVNVARAQAWAGEKGRHELEQVNKELLFNWRAPTKVSGKIG
ncbi:hypothetical protein NQ314_009595 [Rhamnusium bicolor]|uniref:Hamartin n=1 Tax=Rhamnusium bicolor TaxID=1586634 RepID=A0AAV8XYE8_9CUCU|nr:hypothetical protein NQ314_009595 [Rhamnusium bicolor]